MTSKFLDKWTRKRAVGKRSYVLRNGVLFIGFGLVLLFSILDLVNNGTIGTTYLISRLIFFPTIGAMYAGIRWESNERKFAKLTGSGT